MFSLLREALCCIGVKRMGGSLIALGFIALGCSYSKRHGWDRDCLIGSAMAIIAGLVSVAIN